MSRYTLECLLEPLIGILTRLVDLRHVDDFPDEDTLDPAAAEFAIHVSVTFRVGLGAISDAQELPLREPSMDLLDSRRLVGLRS